MEKVYIIYVLWIFLNQILSEKSLKLKRVESPDRKVLFYFDEVIFIFLLLDWFIKNEDRHLFL